MTDQGGQNRSQTFSLTVVASGGGQPGQPGANPAITNTAFPAGTVGAPYQQVLLSSGGCVSPFSAPATYSVTGGALPSGLTIQAVTDRTFAVAGTPAAAGTFNFSLTVTDPCAKTGTANFSVTIAPAGSGGGQTGPVTSNPVSLNFILAGGNGFQDQQLAVNGPAGTTFTAVAAGGAWLNIIAVSSGTFPATLTVRAAGSAGALAAGTYNGAINVSSSAGELSVPVNLTVTGPSATLALSPAAINYTVASGAAPLLQTVSVTNATGPAQFNVQTFTVNGGTQWLKASITSGTAPASFTLTLTPAGLQPSLYTGTVVITPVNPVGSAQVIPVNLLVMPPASVSIAPNDLKFVAADPSTPPQPQTVTVSSTGLPFDSSVRTTTTSGGDWLSATPPLGTTPVSVTVQVNTAGLDAGTYQGSLTVSPASPGVNPVTVSVTLTVTQSGPSIRAITNGASFQPGDVAPGEIITIFGGSMGPSDLAPSRLTDSGSLASMVEESAVYFDGIAAPLIYTSDKQLAAVVPYAVAGQPTTKVQIEYRGVRSSPLEVPVARSAPAIFTLSAKGQAAALNEDGSINSIENGAEPGTLVALYATGEGQTRPEGVDGKIATDVYPVPVLPVSVRVNAEYADVKYAGAAPQIVAGVMQVNILLPKDLPRGVAVPVVLVVGETASVPVTIGIKP